MSGAGPDAGPWHLASVTPPSWAEEASRDVVALLDALARNV